VKTVSIHRIKCGKYFVYLPQNPFNMAQYIYQHENWTTFIWDFSRIAIVLSEVRHLQGKLLGTMNAL
jgi:hypothetical protein